MYIKFRLDRRNERKQVLSKECCQSSLNKLEKIKIGSTFFKKEMKSPAVWIGSKSVIGEKAVCPESVLLVTDQQQMS